MKLSTLFERCLHQRYLHTPEGADYAIDRRGNTLYLYFQDSDGLVDWKNNLDFPAKPYQRMGKTVWYAHRGFLKVWKSAQVPLEKYILDPTVKKTVLVGYSHGAAIAALCHEYVWYHRPDLRSHLEGYGFGSPRVFWGLPKQTAKERWETFLVIRNMDDIVTHLPPVFLGYSHVGEILRIGKKGKYSRIDAHRPENILTELRLYEKALRPAPVVRSVPLLG